MAVFRTKLYNRLTGCCPLIGAEQAQALPWLRRRWRTLDQHVYAYITRARLGEAA
jgi:hypothetical protein